MHKLNLQIIVAEDDADDQMLLLDAFSDNQIDGSKVFFAEDGEALLKKLKMMSPSPKLILLDLNMPKKDGRETLREIKMDKDLKHIPVIILTTSNADSDVIFTYREGGNTYFTKPKLYSDLVGFVGILKKYWLEKAVLSI